MRFSDAAVRRSVRASRWELAGWGVVVAACSLAPLPGLGLVVALVLAVTVLRHHRTFATWMVVLGAASLMAYGLAGLLLPLDGTAGWHTSTGRP